MPPHTDSCPAPRPPASTPPQLPAYCLLLHVCHPHAAGIDIGEDEPWVAVPPERASPPGRRFGTCTTALDARADWLLDCGITTGAMASTGVDGMPLFERWEARGVLVCLSDPRHAPRAPGRPQPTRRDGQWRQRLHAYGRLAGACRPDDQGCVRRRALRHRHRAHAGSSGLSPGATRQRVRPTGPRRLRSARPRTSASTPMPRHSGQEALRAAPQARGIHTRASVHTLRHAWATPRRDAGVHLRLMPPALGHHAPSPTARAPHLTGHADALATAAITRRLDALSGPWEDCLARTGGELPTRWPGLSPPMRRPEATQSPGSHAGHHTVPS